MSEAEKEKLRQACAWARVFIDEAQKALVDKHNRHRSSANQLMHLLAEIVVTRK